MSAMSKQRERCKRAAWAAFQQALKGKAGSVEEVYKAGFEAGAYYHEEKTAISMAAASAGRCRPRKLGRKAV